MIELTVQDAGMHHVNMVRCVVAGLQEFLLQEQALLKTLMTVSKPHEHVANGVQNMQNQLASQLQHVQTMIQAMQLKYSAVS